MIALKIGRRGGSRTCWTATRCAWPEGCASCRRTRASRCASSSRCPASSSIPWSWACGQGGAARFGATRNVQDVSERATRVARPKPSALIRIFDASLHRVGDSRHRVHRPSRHRRCAGGGAQVSDRRISGVTMVSRRFNRRRRAPFRSCDVLLPVATRAGAVVLDAILSRQSACWAQLAVR